MIFCGVLAGLAVIFLLNLAHNYGMETGRLRGWNEAFSANWLRNCRYEGWRFDENKKS